MRAAVVIPVHADPEGLDVTLRSIAADGGAPVVVVVDGAHPETEQVAAAAGAHVVVLPTSQGSYAARNAGIDAVADGADAVLLTDAGCAVAPGWVDAHLRALATSALSGGAVEVVHGPRPTAAEWVDRCRNLRQESYVRHAGFAATCNLAVRREVLAVVRFDSALRSGGDRDFCVRATAAGFSLAYTPDATVLHPARRTASEVLRKARRVGEGVAALPPATRPPLPRPQRPSRALARRAREAGVTTTPLWAASVAWLDWRRAVTLRRAALRPPPLDGLHIVVLLGSRWAALESMNTRWRRVVQAWVHDPRISRVTLVDHPWFRMRAPRGLVESGTSWLQGVELLELTVPTTLRPGRLDALAWRRAARALERRLPDADRRVVVSTSPVNARLLPLLRRGTTTAFDAVDIWRNTNVEGPLGERLRDGFAGIAGADVATAVSAPLAEALQTWRAGTAIVVPNGVQLSDYATDNPPEPLGLPTGPFAVYVGSLSSRLDLDLVDRVAQELQPDLEIVLAGPADAATSDRLRAMPVRWLGPIPTTLVPGLLRRAAVGLYPHQPTDLTETVDSMKVLEYLAAGLPVVSTPPGSSLSAVVTASPHEFAAAVRQAARGARTHAPHPEVRSCDWSHVAEALLSSYSDLDVKARR